MPLSSSKRRVEDTHEPERGADPKDVSVVLVEGIDGARRKLVALAGCQILDLGRAFHDVAGFEVVAILHLQIGACLHHRVMQGEAHAIVAQQQTAAPPPLAGHVALRPHHLRQRTNDHLPRVAAAAAA